MPDPRIEALAAKHQPTVHRMPAETTLAVMALAAPEEGSFAHQLAALSLEVEQLRAERDAALARAEEAEGLLRRLVDAGGNLEHSPAFRLAFLAARAFIAAPPAPAPPRPAPTSLAAEPPYPAHETVLMSFADPLLTAHQPTGECSREEPHPTNECPLWAAPAPPEAAEENREWNRRLIALLKEWREQPPLDLPAELYDSTPPEAQSEAGPVGYLWRFAAHEAVAIPAMLPPGPWNFAPVKTLAEAKRHTQVDGPPYDFMPVFSHAAPDPAAERVLRAAEAWAANYKSEDYWTASEEELLRSVTAYRARSGALQGETDV
jgi:hypothetical protein